MIIKAKREELQKIELQIKKSGEQYKNYNMILLAHYHKILKDGIDTRSEGLVWVIKEIFALGSKVLLSYLPNFLDEKCIIFLFKVLE